jgi:Rrf2 family protein
MSKELRRTSTPLIIQQTSLLHLPWTSISYIAGPALPTINPGVCVGVMGVCVGVREVCVGVRGVCVGVRVVMQIFGDLSGCPREVPGCIDPLLARERTWAKACTPQRPPVVHFHHRVLHIPPYNSFPMKLDSRIHTGILVARELAKNPENFASAREIAEKLGLPEIPVRQALVRLRRAGILQAEKGRQGGYRLTKPPEKISLLSVLRALADGDPVLALFSERGRRGKPYTPDKTDPTAGLWERLEREFWKFLRIKPSPIYANRGT